MAWKGFNPNLMQEAGRVLYPDQGRPLPQDREVAAGPDAAAPPWPVYPGGDPIFDRLLKRTLGDEGPYVKSKPIDGGPTNEGISQGLLDDLNNKTHREWQLPKKTGELTREQREGLYWQVFYKEKRIDELARVPGLMEKAPEFVEHVFDTWVMTAPPEPGKWLQQALDEVLKTNLRVPDKSGALVYQGNIRERTRDAVAKALADGLIKDVNNSLADKRWAYYEGRENFKDNERGWRRRVESHRMR